MGWRAVSYRGRDANVHCGMSLDTGRRAGIFTDEDKDSIR